MYQSRQIYTVHLIRLFNRHMILSSSAKIDIALLAAAGTETHTYREAIWDEVYVSAINLGIPGIASHTPLCPMYMYMEGSALARMYSKYNIRRVYDSR